MSKKAAVATTDPQGGGLAAVARLVLALGAASLGALTAPPALAQAPCMSMPLVRIQEWPGDIINIVPWVAEAKGLFRKHCLDVKFVSVVGAPASTTALANGTIEYASHTVDGVMRVRARGLDIRMTANMYAGHWAALVAGNGLPLPRLGEGYPGMMKDLAGKKVGVTALAATTEAFVKSAFEGAGMSPESATYVAVGGATTAVPALSGGVVDAAMMFGTGPELAEALGVGNIVLDYRKPGVGPPIMQALRGATLGWSAYGPYIDKNPEAVAAFTRANNDAIAWIQNAQNRNELYRIIGGKVSLPDTVPKRDETLKRIIDVHASLLAPGIPVESIAGWNKFLISLQQIPAPTAYDDVVWKTAKP